MTQEALIFTVDGNIGATKSTLLEYMHTHYKLPIDLEPVNKWEPYLTDMYKYNKSAFEFQVRVWLDRCWIQAKSNIYPMLMERSPYFQRNVFIPINHDNNKLSDREFATLDEMYKKSNDIWLPNGYIYLRSDPDKCIERIKNRGRKSEENIDPEYIKKLHELHEESYNYAVFLGYPIICINIENKTTPQIAQEVWKSLSSINNLHNVNLPKIK